VLVLGSTVTDSEPWVRAFQMLRKSYGLTKFEDLEGAKALASIGYECVDMVRSDTQVRVTQDYLVKNTLSYGSCTKNVLADLPAFQEKLGKILEPHLEGGSVKAKILSWAYVYGQK